MQAHFLSVLRTPSERTLVLRIGESVFPATLEAEPAAESLDQLRAGTVVDVTGVYAYQWGPSPSFRLFLRSRGDVKVIAAAPLVDAPAHRRDDRDPGARRVRARRSGCGRRRSGAGSSIRRC